MNPASVLIPLNQEEFEAAIVHAFRRQFSEISDIIGEQVQASTVSDRQITNTGCYIYFDVPESCPRLPETTEYPLQLDPYVLADIGKGNAGDVFSPDIVPPAFANGNLCGALLIHNQRGLISYIDCHSFGEVGWPQDKYKFWFFESEARN